MHAINPIIYKVDDGFAGFAAELPGATGQGETIDETIAEIISAIEELATEYKRRNILVPWKVMAPVKPVEIAV